MRAVSRIAAAFLIALPCACSNPVPPDKIDYVGEWSTEGMFVLITESGQVRYWRRVKGIKNSLNGPIKRFEGDNFVVGLGPISTTFVVSRPPHLERGVWKMTVDGIELSRSKWSGAPGSRA